MLAAAIAAKPAMLSVSFGDDFSWVQRAHDAGIVAATQIGDLRAAVRAVDAGVDVVIARGAEAGGHGLPSVGTLPLLASVLDELCVPVLAAGGISSGRETLSSDETRRALLPAEDTDTVATRVFDIALGYPWSARIPERVLRNGFTERWHGNEKELAADRDASAALQAAIAAGDHRLAPINAGQGVGMLRTVRPAAEVIDQLCNDASRLLGRRYIS